MLRREALPTVWQILLPAHDAPECNVAVSDAPKDDTDLVRPRPDGGKQPPIFKHLSRSHPVGALLPHCLPDFSILLQGVPIARSPQAQAAEGGTSASVPGLLRSRSAEYRR